MNLLDILFPPRCVFCRKACGQTLCAGCQSALPWLTEQREDGVLAPLYYTEEVRRALLRFKFSGYLGYARMFALLMSQLVLDEGVSADVVAYVPCSRRRSHRRGYDQCRELAGELAKILGLPVERMLVKTRHNRSQREARGAKERRENVRGAFAVCGNPSGKRVLLVDDIHTTGATLDECRAMLTLAGAREVRCVVAARRGRGEGFVRTDTISK